MRRPQIIEENDAPSGRIDHDWSRSVAAAAQPAEPRLGNAGLGILGLLLFFGGWVLFGAANFIADEFARAAWLGWLALAVLSAGLAAFAGVGFREMRGLAGLRRVEKLQQALGDTRAAPAPTKRLVLDWLTRLPEAAPHHRAVLQITDPAGLRLILAEEILPPLDEKAQAVWRQTAWQVLAATSITPSASLEAVIFILQSARLVRKIASIYGLRPGAFGTAQLLRRILLDAALIATTDVAATLAARAILSNPILETLAGDTTAAALAAQRIARLGAAASAACRPLPY